MTIEARDRKILWARSHNACAYCRQPLVLNATEVDRETVVGDEAHIIAQSAAGPRGGQIAAKDLDKYENLILLCKVHHKMIDDQPVYYTIERVRRLKFDHEEWAAEKFGAADVRGEASADNGKAEDIEPEILSHVPRTQLDINHVIAYRPWLWEYFLLAGHLNIGVREIKSRATTSNQGHRRRLKNADDALEWARELFEQAGTIAEELNLALDPSFQVQAFGRQGNPPGDFRLIGEVARRILAVYEHLLDWSESAKWVDAPLRLRHLVRCASRLPDEPVLSMEKSIGRLICELQNLLDTDAARSKTPIVLILKMSLELDEGLQNEIIGEMRRISR